MTEKERKAPIRVTNCLQCGSSLEHLKGNYPWRKFCSLQCSRKWQVQEHHKYNPVRGLALPYHVIGTIAELRVAADLMLKGYKIFRAIANNSCDLVILKNGQLLRVEVKSGFRTLSGKPYKQGIKKGHESNYDVLAHVFIDEIVYEPELSLKQESQPIVPVREELCK